MKKRLFLLFGLIALVALIAPAVLGTWLPGQIDASLDEHWPDATRVIERRWFSTSVIAQQGASRLNAQFQHLPWWRGAWLIGTGELILAEPEAQIALDAHLSLSGQFQIDASSDSIRWSGPEDNRIERAVVSLLLQGDRQGTLMAHAHASNISDPYGNELQLEAIQIESDWQATSEALNDWRLNVQAARPEQTASQLQLTAASIDGEAMNALIAAFSELNSAPPESLQAQMAGLGLLGAWQQLVQSGIAFDLHEFALDQQIDISGRWQPGENTLDLSGGGYTPAAIDWIAPILGLNQRIPPEQARSQVWQLMQDAADHNAMTLNGEHFDLTLNEMTQP